MSSTTTIHEEENMNALRGMALTLVGLLIVACQTVTPSVTPATGGGGPDLVVEAFRPGTGPTGFCQRGEDSPGQGHFEVMIANRGNQTAGASVLQLALEPGGTLTWDVDLTIAPGARTTVRVPMNRTSFTCFDPDCQYRIIADAGNRIRESNEENNTAAATCIG
jgi:hypothetical protein